MNIDIKTNTVQNVTSDEIDSLAKNLCGVKLSLADTGKPIINCDTISATGISAVSSDGVYSDARIALAEKGVTVTSDTTLQRILDPEVKRVLLDVVGIGSNGKITESEFSSLTGSRIGTAFRNNTDIVNFDEIKYTPIRNTGDLNAYAFDGCTNLKSIDLSNFTALDGAQYHFRNAPLENIGSLDNIERISSWSIRGVTGSQYKNLTMPNLIRITGTGDNKYIGYTTTYYSVLPASTEWFYAPNCVETLAITVWGDTMKYIYFPKMRDFGGVFSDDSYSYSCPNLKILSIGENVQYVRSLLYRVASDSAQIIHADTFELLDGVNTGGKYDSDSRNYTLNKNIFVVNYQMTPSRYKFVDPLLCEIGFVDWKNRMESCAEDRDYELPDQYTDFYYDYIDYMLGGIPLPEHQLGNPSVIEIRAEGFGTLSDNAEICTGFNSINLRVYINSYKNASTLEIVEDQAGVTLDQNRTMTIPSTANGETVTLKATNLYNSQLSTTVTIKVYDKSHGPYVVVDPVVKKCFQIVFQDRYHVHQNGVIQALSDVVDLPRDSSGRTLFYDSQVVDLTLLKYTKITNLYKTGNKGSFENCRSLQYVSLPDTLEIIGDGAFYNCSSLQSIVIPESVTTIEQQAFRGSGVKYMTFLSTVPPTIGHSNTSLGDAGSYSAIYVPQQSVEAYKEAFPSQYSSKIFAIPE